MVNTKIPMTTGRMNANELNQEMAALVFFCVVALMVPSRYALGDTPEGITIVWFQFAALIRVIMVFLYSSTLP